MDLWNEMRSLAVKDRRGTALIEFAFAVPVLVLLFVGGFQISDGVFAYRKATSTARTLADLTSQYTAVTDADLDLILNASRQVLAPYSVTSAQVRVSQIVIDAAGTATVDWSRGLNTPAFVKGASFYVPGKYRQNGATIIVADVVYHYVPSFASSLIGPIDLREQATMYPRKSTSITKS